jgi:very-short-patch-repair endonuclease
MLSWSIDDLESHIARLERWKELKDSLKEVPDFLSLIKRVKVLGPEKLTLLSHLDETIINLDALDKAYNEAFNNYESPTWADIEGSCEASKVIKKFDHLFKKDNLNDILLNEEKSKELIEKNKELIKEKNQIEGKLKTAIKDQNIRKIEGIITNIQDRLGSFWRWLSSDYRNAITEAKSLFLNPARYASGGDLANELTNIVRLYEELSKQSSDINELTQYLKLQSLESLESTLDDIEEIRESLVINNEVLLNLWGLSKDPKRLESLDKIPSLYEKSIQGITDIKNILSLEHEFRLSIKDSKGLLESIKKDLSLIETKCRYNILLTELEANSLLELSTQIEVKGLSQNVIADSIRFSYFTLVAKQMLSELPELENFDTKNHQELIKEFKSLDLERLKQSKIKVLEKHQSNLPARQGGIGITGMLMEEMELRRGGTPIRKIMEAGAQAIQKIKPVFMMSPTSVAQYLPNKSIKFDILIIDEASQVKPMEVLGCFGRCKQYVVVGDSKQLPPTDFFNKIIDSPETESEEDFGVREAKEMESILTLCYARGMKERYLNWHYRSRHPSLIALSNREFYDSRLWVIPSPYRDHKDIGLKFTKVEEGLYSRGTSTDNIPEGKRIVARLKELAKANDPRSILVATLSVSQRDTIDNLIEIERQGDLTLNEYLNRNVNEPFTVKNLESVQGDERDIVLISIGYGKDSNSKLYMDFGPISREGGERRLNVLMTRARELCEVYSSISSSGINLGKATSRGALILKEFLAYAESGVMKDFSTPRGETMSPFEESVKQKIEEHGHEVHTQVGEAGFFIDLAIVNPTSHGEYILGIECDGASYHSSLCARDRDRLRQQVLEDKGWKLHRIWSTDWFERETQELEEILEKIHRSKEILKRPKVAHVIERDLAKEENSFSTPYIRFENTQGLKGSNLILEIIKVEGPIHKDELSRRYSSSLGLSKTGSKIKTEVNSFILKMIQSRTLDSGENMNWVWLKNQTIPIRNRSEVGYSLRKPEFLPPCEIRKTIEVCVKECHGATREELEKSVPRQLGFSSVSQLLKNVISKQIDEMLKDKILEESQGLLRANLW